MKLKWGSEAIKYFNKKIPIAERVSWLDRFDNLFWWVVLATCAGAVVWILYKLYCLYKITVWFESL